MHPYDYKTVANLTFGADRTQELGEIAARYGITRALVVTDPGIIEHNLLERALTCLTAQGVEHCLFSKTMADPPEETIEQATELAREFSCNGVIGYGGGSSMDVAKLVAVLIRSDQPLQEMYGVDQVTGKRAPLIQVPTTAGTGSEATAVAIVTTGESTKAGVVSDVLFADHIVLDPRLTVDLPAHITAATGIDAMVHAIEAYTSKLKKNPLSDMVAVKALRLLSGNIEAAVNNGHDLQARSDMLLGAMLAGQAFANAPVAAVHALAYPLGGTFHIPHGLSNSLVLPHVLRFNEPEAGELYLQLAPSILTDQQIIDDPYEVTHQLADHFLNLARGLGLQTTLHEMEIRKEHLEDLAEQAMLQQRLLINNPREVKLEDALHIYQQAF